LEKKIYLNIENVQSYCICNLFRKSSVFKGLR